MALKSFDTIRNNYEYYSNLLSERKSIFDKVLEIKSLKNNNSNTLEESFAIKHSLVESGVVLIICVKINNHSFFQFKFRYKEFFERPFFRYDNDGDTHWNRIEGIPLPLQSVDTPHFHKYTKDGIEIAYQTEILKNEKERKALEDIELCIIHFFHESNTRLNDDDFPKITILPNSLGLKSIKQDPNKNVDFL